MLTEVVTRDLWRYGLVLIIVAFFLYLYACACVLFQQSRLNLAPNGGLKRALSRSSSKEKKDQRLWITSVPKEISDALSLEEKKRQEVIYELVYTEKDFVNDLKYLNDVSPISPWTTFEDVDGKVLVYKYSLFINLEMDCAHSDHGHSARA